MREDGSGMCPQLASALDSNPYCKVTSQSLGMFAIEHLLN